MAMSDQEIEMHMSRLSGMAEEFERAYKSGEYGMAHWILLKAEVIADYLKLPGQQMSQLLDSGRRTMRKRIIRKNCSASRGPGRLTGIAVLKLIRPIRI